MYFPPFLLGLEGWEKRLIISDRAHIGKEDVSIMYLFLTVVFPETYHTKAFCNQLCL